jgi:transcription termination factor Rho
MGKKEKSTRHKKTTTKQTNLAATYQGVLDIAKSGMGFVMVPNMER